MKCSIIWNGSSYKNVNESSNNVRHCCILGKVDNFVVKSIYVRAIYVAII